MFPAAALGGSASLIPIAILSPFPAGIGWSGRRRTPLSGGAIRLDSLGRTPSNRSQSRHLDEVRRLFWPLAFLMRVTELTFVVVRKEGGFMRLAWKIRAVGFALLLLGPGILAPGLAAQQPAPPQPQAQAPPAAPTGAPVVVDGRTLFYVPSRMFTFSPEDRARAIAERVQFLSRQAPSRIAAIGVVDAETTSEIDSEDLVIATITDADAQAAGRTRQELAQEYAQAIRQAALAMREQYGWRTILLGILYSLLATAVLIVLFKFLGVGISRLQDKLKAWDGVYIRSIRIQKLELLPAARITAMLQLTGHVTRVALSLLLVYSYLTLVLNFFPWTQGYATILLGYVLSPLRAVGRAVVGYLPNLFFLLVIVVVAYYATRLVKFFFNEVAKGTLTLPGFYPDWAMPTYKIVRLLILAFTLIIAFPYLPGSSSPAFQGVSLFFGVLFSLGSSSAISNVVAGVVLTYTRAFQLGDRVKIGDTIGDVIEKTLLVTRVRTIKNVEISIPNAMVLSSHIINFSYSAQEQGLILNTTVTIGYNTPWRTVHQLLIDAALATENVLREPKPFVFQTALNDFYVSYEINAFTDQPNRMARTYSDLHQNIQDQFNKAGVEIMSPHYSQLRDGNQITIPRENLPKDYSAPGFRLVSLENTQSRGNQEGKAE
jgi:small-conductance mechanosensitive channel